MPKEPRGQKRPADLVGNAVHSAKIATGELEDTLLSCSGRRRSGLAGVKARLENTTAGERKEIAQKAAAARWK